MKRHLFPLIVGLLTLPAASAMAQNTDVLDRLSDLIDRGNAPIIVILENGSSDATGAAALIANRSATSGSIAGSGVVAGIGGGGLGYTCSGEGDSGTCTCGPNDPCIGMVDACRKLGGRTTTCDNQTKTCSCDY